MVATVDRFVLFDSKCREKLMVTAGSAFFCAISPGIINVRSNCPLRETNPLQQTTERKFFFGF